MATESTRCEIVNEVFRQIGTPRVGGQFSRSRRLHLIFEPPLLGWDRTHLARRRIANPRVSAIPGTQPERVVRTFRNVDHDHP